jgi:hypothetical protein
VAAAVFVVLAVAALVARVWPLLVVAAVVAAGYRARRRPAARSLSPRPGTPAARQARPDLAAVAADRDRLAAEVAEVRADRDRLAAEVAEAREVARLAWDAAASAVPRCHSCRRPLDDAGECPAACGDGPPEPRAALLADPRSGARPLGGAR